MAIKDGLRGWRQRVTAGAALLGGTALATFTLVTVGGLGWYEYREIIESDLNQTALQARVLEDHARRTFDSASVLLNALSGQVDLLQQPGGLMKTDAMLAQSLIALPSIRSISVLDGKGLVVSSSDPDQLGLHIAMERLGTLPAAGREAIGPFVTGRGLRALDAGQAKGAPNPQVGFIPMLRAHATDPLYLVALINPDYLANFQVQTLNDPRRSASLLSYQGQALATTGQHSVTPGTSMAGHTVFRDYLPRQEQAAFLERIGHPERHLVAYRVSPTRPLVVLVEQHHRDSLERWFDTMRWFGLAALTTVGFLIVMATMVRRSQRAREQAQTALETAQLDVVRREQELRVLLRSLQELIFRTDDAGRLTYVNDRWLAMRGQTVAQTLNRPLLDVIEPADRDAVRALFARNSGAGVRTATARVHSGDGRVYRFDFAVVALTNAQGLVGFAGSAVDVTKRYAAERALQHQLEFVAQMLESSPLPVAAYDQSGRYVTVNRAWEEFHGRSRDLVIGRQRSAFMPMEEANLHGQRDEALWRSGGKVSYEATVRHRDGSRRDAVITKVVVPGNEYSAPVLLSTMMDVSEFREAERATRLARDAAEEASRAKSEFIANISHELRTPLQSILGFSELGLLRGAQHPKLHAMFTDIHGSGSRMLALVNDLLDVSKIESSVGAITLERADLRGLVHSVMRELTPLLAARHLTLAIELGEQPLIAKVDPVRFGQVIRNVTANAIKFSPMGQVIDVQARLTAEEDIRISVRDRGDGIPEGELDAIFEAFVQSSSSKDGSGGTGLGLAICRKIMTAHDGRLWAENDAAGGAVFHIELPARHHLDRETTY